MCFFYDNSLLRASERTDANSPLPSVLFARPSHSICLLPSWLLHLKKQDADSPFRCCYSCSPWPCSPPCSCSSPSSALAPCRRRLLLSSSLLLPHSRRRRSSISSRLPRSHARRLPFSSTPRGHLAQGPRLPILLPERHNRSSGLRPTARGIELRASAKLRVDELPFVQAASRCCT